MARAEAFNDSGPSAPNIDSFFLAYSTLAALLGLTKRQRFAAST